MDLIYDQNRTLQIILILFTFYFHEGIKEEKSYLSRMEHRSARAPRWKWAAFIFVLALLAGVYGYKSQLKASASNHDPAMSAKADSMSAGPVPSCCIAPLSRGKMLSGKISPEGVRH